MEETPLIVVKKEGVREEFSREKMLRGLIKACEKRPVSLTSTEFLFPVCFNLILKQKKTKIVIRLNQYWSGQ